MTFDPAGASTALASLFVGNLWANRPASSTSSNQLETTFQAAALSLFPGRAGVRSWAMRMAVASGAVCVCLPANAMTVPPTVAVASEHDGSTCDLEELPASPEAWLVHAAAPEGWVVEALAAINHIDELVDFNAGTKPSEWSQTQAKNVVAAVAYMMRPSRIVPMADGGVGIVFPRVGRRVARLDITNDEEIVATLIDDREQPSFFEIAPDEVAHFLISSLQLS